ncbi:hypothetical protein [Amycolatopsis taiwanensis]|uniref:hypothetical protein n=1 Tax=Amycolatopsis taiwanensis TaxID=342230 RepID=UPI0004858D67|nr:hypothetical protein [Amycolatopsis taiwanensis]
MTGVDPAIENRFAEILAKTRANAAVITDRVEATKREIAEQSQRMREQNEQMCKELDERSQARAAAKEDPAAKNQWLRRSPGQDSTFHFGDVEEQPQEKPEPTGRVPSPPPRRRARRAEEFEDEDFTHKNWLD